MKRATVAILLAVVFLSVVATVVFHNGAPPRDYRERTSALESSVARLKAQLDTLAGQQDNSRASFDLTEESRDENRQEELLDLLRGLTLATKQLTLVVSRLGNELLDQRAIGQPQVQPEVFPGVRVGDHVETVKQKLGEPDGGRLTQDQSGRLFLRYENLGTQFVLADYRVVTVETIAE